MSRRYISVPALNTLIQINEELGARASELALSEGESVTEREELEAVLGRLRSGPGARLGAGADDPTIEALRAEGYGPLADQQEFLHEEAEEEVAEVLSRVRGSAHLRLRPAPDADSSAATEPSPLTEEQHAHLSRAGIRLRPRGQAK